MKNWAKGHIWWWLMVIVAIAGVSYFIYTQVGREKPEQPKALEDKQAAPVVTKPVLPEQPTVTEAEEERRGIALLPKEEEFPTEPSLKEAYCEKAEKEIVEFFYYLDQKQYVRRLDTNGNSYARFKKILQRSSARPPVPAGEGTDPKIIVKNLYHFFRVLGRKDISLIRKVIANERDSMEYNLAMFYKWITLDERCPDPERVRPSMKVRYQYAGFFLNTIGGRAYLFRRTQGLRLLAGYYCVLIAHEADKKGENRYGIDLLPHIAPLKVEISRYPEFEFQQDYIEALNRIENYYSQRR